MLHVLHKFLAPKNTSYFYMVNETASYHVLVCAYHQVAIKSEERIYIVLEAEGSLYQFYWISFRVTKLWRVSRFMNEIMK